jgi:hypothetical protein
VHGEPELVGEPLADQAVAEGAAAEHDDVLAVLLLELRDLVRDRGARDPGVGPVDLLQRLASR